MARTIKLYRVSEDGRRVAAGTRASEAIARNPEKSDRALAAELGVAEQHMRAMILALDWGLRPSLVELHRETGT